MKPALAVAAVVAVVTVVYVFFFRDDDEAMIRKQLTRLEEAVRIKERGTNPIFYFGRVKGKLETLVDPAVSVDLQEASVFRSGRDEVVKGAVQVAGLYDTVDVHFERVEVKLDEAHRSAQVTTAAELDTVRGGRAQKDERAVSFHLAKGDDGWRITSVSIWPPSP